MVGGVGTPPPTHHPQVWGIPVQPCVVETDRVGLAVSVQVVRDGEAEGLKVGEGERDMVTVGLGVAVWGTDRETVELKERETVRVGVGEGGEDAVCVREKEGEEEAVVVGVWLLVWEKLRVGEGRGVHTATDSDRRNKRRVFCPKAVVFCPKKKFVPERPTCTLKLSP